MSVFLFYLFYLLLLASKKVMWQILKPLKQELRELLIINYPFFPPFFQIDTVINNKPKNNAIKKTIVPINKNFSSLVWEEVFTYPFKKSPKYVKTKTKTIPKPLLISLSSSYRKSFITKIKSVSVSAFFAKTVQMLMQKYQIKLQNHQLKVSSKFHHSFFLHLSKSIPNIIAGGSK